MKNSLEPYKPAQIAKGEDEWYVYYKFLDPDTNTYKPFKIRSGLNTKRIKKTPVVRKKLAEDIRDRINGQLKGGFNPFITTEAVSEDDDRLKFIPVCDALRKINSKRKGTMKRRSGQSYDYSVNAFSKYLESTGKQGLTIGQVTKKTTIAFHDYLIEKGYANKTVNTHKEFLTTLYNRAIKRGIAEENPFKDVDVLEVEVGKNFAFNEQQVKALKEEILKSRPQMWLFVKCIFHLFIRPIELLQIRISDIDLVTGQVIIHSSVGKNKNQLPAQIPDTLIPELRKLIPKEAPAEWFLFGKGYAPGPKNMSRNTVSGHHSEILKACKIPQPKYSLYGWKHTGNVAAYKAKADLYSIMRQNRHHSIEQTMEYLRSLGLEPNIAFKSTTAEI